MAVISRANTATAGFTLDSFAEKALDVLISNMKVAKWVARDTDFTDVSWIGKTLTVPYTGTFSASSLTDGGTVSIQTPSNGNSVTLTLDKYKATDFTLIDYSKFTSSPQMQQMYINAAVKSLAEAIETDVVNAVVGSGTTYSGSFGAGLTYADILTAQKYLFDNKLPDGMTGNMLDKMAIVTSADQKAMYADSSLLGYFQRQQPQRQFEMGVIGEVLGFDIMPSQLAPYTVGTGGTSTFAHRECVLLAQRKFEPIEDPGIQVSQVQDPNTGFSIRVLKQYDMASRGIRIGVDVLYGVTTLRSNASYRIKTS